MVDGLHGLAANGARLVQQLPASTIALRTADYKLVRNAALTYVPGSDSCQDLSSDELYAVNQAIPVPALDRAPDNLLLQPLSGALQQIYADLLARLGAVLDSQPACPGDGNQDGVVDAADVAHALRIAATWGGSSVYDVNLDGLTNDADVQSIRTRIGTCPK